MDTVTNPNVKYIYIFMIICIVSFIVLYFIQIPSTNLNVEKKGPYNLYEPGGRKLFTNNNSFKTNTSVSFQGFFYLEGLQKTGIVRNCRPTDASGSCADFDTGRFDICQCSATDCSGCKHNEYVSLLDINGRTAVLEILPSPDAGRQNKAYTQLTIKTQATDNLQIETFVLPPMPFQKWIMITINRDGRRFDVYYNDTLVLSKLASAPLYTGEVNSDILVGSKDLSGSCGFFSVYSRSQTATDISRRYNTFTTTRDSPLFDVAPPTMDWKSLSVATRSLDTIAPEKASIPSFGLPNLCVGSDCISSATNPPAKPYYEWRSSYA
jgi:hypothetical protein